eukprot:5347042-Pleurochrysis_carterae.AAC.1
MEGTYLEHLADLLPEGVVEDCGLQLVDAVLLLLVLVLVVEIVVSHAGGEVLVVIVVADHHLLQVALQAQHTRKFTITASEASLLCAVKPQPLLVVLVRDLAKP